MLNTALIIGGIGPFIMPATVAGKIFFALYGMLIGLLFVATLGLILAPVAPSRHPQVPPGRRLRHRRDAFQAR